MKSKLGNITKGDWEYELVETDYCFFPVIARKEDGKVVTHVGIRERTDVETEEFKSNAALIADAGTTANKSGKLPSELLAEVEELKDELQFAQDCMKMNYNDSKPIKLEQLKRISNSLSK